MLEEDSEPIIMDIGSGTLKAGFANDDQPKAWVPMIVGEPKAPGIMVGMDQKDHYFGHEAVAKRAMLNISEPVEAGIVKDYHMLEQILKDCIFNSELGVNPEEHKILISEPPNNPKKNREDMVYMMFETFKVPKLYLGNQAVMSLFATGRTTGTVLDAGEGITHAVPIYEGYAIPHAIQTIPLSGRLITQYLQKLLYDKNPILFGDQNDTDHPKLIKEKMCLVAQDFDAELKQAQEQNSLQKIYYDLPGMGDKPLILNEERIKCPELLFCPSLMDLETEGIHKFTHDCIIKCDYDIRKDLFKNIVMAGGSTMFFGMKERMRKEIQALAPSPMQPDVEAPADRKYSCWLGGAILSLIEKFDNMWITRKDYEEGGKQVVHRKCF